MVWSLTGAWEEWRRVHCEGGAGDEKVSDYLLGLVGLGELREGGMISLSLFAYAKMPCTNDSKFKNEVHRRILLTLNSLAIFSL